MFNLISFRSRQLSGVALAALLLTGPLAQSAFAQQQGGQGPAPVDAVTVTTADHVLTARLPGRVKASTVAEVRPQVSGIIRERLFNEGALVAQGDPIYKIEDESYRAAVAAAKAAVAQAEANYSLSVTDEKRAIELYSSKAGSEQRRDAAIAGRQGAEAGLQAAKAQLMSAEIDLDRTTIRAPIAGVIGLSQTTTGALVAAQQPGALATIRNLDTVYVDVTQSFVDILKWGKGQSIKDLGEADLLLADGTVFGVRGKLQAAEPQVEPTTGMVTLRMTFPNPDHTLLPGMYVEVDLPQAVAKDAVLLPQSAVMRDRGGNPLVWVVEGGMVAVRPIEIATSSGNQWVVSSGLKSGDQVITAGFQKTGPGAPVAVVPAAAGAPGAGAPAAAKGAPASDAPATEAPATEAPASDAPAEAK